MDPKCTRQIRKGRPNNHNKENGNSSPILKPIKQKGVSFASEAQITTFKKGTYNSRTLQGVQTMEPQRTNGTKKK